MRATLLPDGRVLITGGSPDNQWHPVRSAEIFDPHTNKFAAISQMELARFKIPDATAVLKNGRILIAGGAAEVELYDNTAGKFFRAGSLDEAAFLCLHHASERWPGIDYRRLYCLPRTAQRPAFLRSGLDLCALNGVATEILFTTSCPESKTAQYQPETS